MRRTTYLGIAIGVAICIPASAATLDVAPGLWEMTSVGEASGMPPIPPEALAHMTPEQREKMQAAMAAAMGRAGQPQVTRSCLTEKMLQRGFDPGDNHRDNCKQTTVSSTPRSFDANMVCTGREHSTGNLHIEAIDQHTVSGSFNFTASDGTNTMTMKRTIQGKWLASDCGNVKPSEE